jgi:predicted CoA-binding protein
MPNPSDQELIEIYRATKTIAVVGASTDPEKPAHRIPEYLQSVGYRIIPVNPAGGELFGERVFTSLDQIDEAVDVVDVFRPAHETPAIARQAVDLGADVLWLQLEIASEGAERIASDGGLTVVMDMCMGATHKRLADRI